MGKPVDRARPEALIARDASNLLHKYGTGGVIVSVASSAMLVYHAAGGLPSGSFLVWWVVMASALLVRAAYLVYWHSAVANAPNRDTAREIRHFSAGTGAIALIWAAFPVLFFSEITPATRSITAVILAGMAGGAATLLAPVRSLALVYIGLLLLPGSICFLLIGGSENTVPGLLGILCFLVLAASARIANSAAIQAIQLSHDKQQLLIEKELERKQIVSANSELRSLQIALEDANEGLERKVRDRTEKLLNEIRERERYEQELSRLASTDPLTGLGNRSSLIRLITGALSEGSPFGVLFIDLDDFKEVNDVRGHHAGDRVLAIVAERLTTAIPTGSELARWGGDEFVVVLRGIDSEESALNIASSLRQEVSQPIDIGGETVWIDGTIGISLFPDHGTTSDKLIRAADVAMYAAKQQRHHRVRLFDPLLAEHVAKGHFLGQCLSAAIANEELTVVYQPIVSSNNSRCVSMEALVRWRHPDHGPVPPNEFIPLAERSGDILALGRWVLMEACRQAAQWPGPEPPSVSVNVSAAQILAGYLVQDVLEAIGESGLPRHRLHLELTESAFAGDFDRVAPVFAELRGLGIRISLDDFGTGFSSLAYLQQLPIDTIKIDKIFVGGMARETKSIVRAIVSLADALGYEVIAEGVELESQRAALVTLGVGFQQGYLYARPLLAAAVPVWLHQQTGDLQTAR
ncbi:MAG: EAL domain-containing protein [Bryobacterales bacterium]|nr:EAL domain-containing protein [Bryobacterales bacterium]